MLKKHILVFLILFFFVPKVQSEEKIAFIDLNYVYSNDGKKYKIQEKKLVGFFKRTVYQMV